MAGDVEIIIGAVGEVGAVVELSKQSRVTTLHSEAPYGHMYDMEFCPHFGQFVRTVHKH